MSLYSSVLNFVKEAIAPAQCLGCGAFGFWVCKDCDDRIEPYFEAVKSYPYIDGMFVVTRFEGMVKEVIHSLKYEGMTEHADYLGRLAASQLDQDYHKGYIVTAVPMHPRKYQGRGFNQSELIAKKVASELQVKYLPILKKTRATAAQVDLTRVERSDNLQNAFESTFDLWGSKIVLIDDVLTTGATLSECAKVLKQAGAHEVYGLVIAKG